MSDSKRFSFLKKYAEGEMLYGIWGIVGRALSAVIAFILLTSLDVFRYGVYVLILALYALLSSFSLRVLANVIFNDVTRYISESRDSDAKRLFWEVFYIRLGMGLFLSIAVFFGADIIATFYDDDIALLIRIFSPIFLITSIHISLDMYVKARMRFAVIAFRPIIQRTVKLAILVYFLVFSVLTINAALYAYIISSAVSMLTYILPFVSAYRPWRTVKPTQKSVLWDIIKRYGKWPLLNQVVTQAPDNIKPWLIKFFVSTEAVALFSVAENIFGAVKSFIPTSTLPVLVPREVTDKKRMSRILLSGTKYLTLFSVILGVSAFLLVPPIIHVFLPHYSDSILLFQVMLIALPILTLKTVGSTFLFALRKQRYLFFVNTIRGAANLAFPIALLSLFGLLGMSYERILTALITGGLMYGYLLRYEVKSGFWRELLTINARDVRFMKQAMEGFASKISSITRRFQNLSGE